MFKKRPKTLAELDDEGDRLDAELSVAQKRELLSQLDKRLGKAGWKKFSDNGKVTGIDFRRMFAWLKSN